LEKTEKREEMKMFSPRPLSLNSTSFWQDVMCNVDRICELIKGTKQVSFFTASPHSTVARFPADQSHLVLLQHEPKNRRNKLLLQDLALVCLTRNPGMFAGPPRHGSHHIPRIFYSRNHVRQGDMSALFAPNFTLACCSFSSVLPWGGMLECLWNDEA
jgi:hypothetical protein